MNVFLLAVAGVILATVAVSLVRVLYGPGAVDRMMAAQLMGTGGVAVLLLIDAASAIPGVGDIALSLALLAAFASVTFVVGVGPSGADKPGKPEA
jgi:multicomponent Na+:H+ antiporter subunit F